MTLEDLLTAGYTLKNRKVSPGLFISLRAMVSGRLSLPFFLLYWLSMEHCVKLKISILLFSVSDDNRLQYICGHFML